MNFTLMMMSMCAKIIKMDFWFDRVIAKIQRCSLIDSRDHNECYLYSVQFARSLSHVGWAGLYSPDACYGMYCGNRPLN